jgi:hypothetical protein
MPGEPIFLAPWLLMLCGVASGATLASSTMATRSRPVGHASSLRQRDPRRALQRHSAEASATLSSGVLLGDTAIESHDDYNHAGLAEASPFRSRANGTLTSIEVYVDSHSAATSVAAGLYSNNNGQPARRLASGAVSSPKAGSWNAVSIQSTAVAFHHTYWIAVLGKGGVLYFRDRSGGRCIREDFGRY